MEAADREDILPQVENAMRLAAQGIGQPLGLVDWNIGIQGNQHRLQSLQGRVG